MLLSTLIFALQVQVDGLQVDGLKPGETLQSIASAKRWSPSGLEPNWEMWPGRVVDAFSGRPVAGASIETWSEEIDEVHGGFYRYGHTTSDLDGRYWIDFNEAGRQAAKARVRAPGYLSLTEAAGYLQQGIVELFPAPDTPPRIRVVDSAGLPIEGALFTSTYSCPHDIPAFGVRSNAAGIAVLPEFGQQRMVPELRLRIPGYASVEYLDALPTLHADPSAPVYTIARPHMRPVRAQLYDRDSAYLAFEPIFIVEGTGFHVLTTDQYGRIEIPWPYNHDEASFKVLDPGEGNHYLSGNHFPSGRDFTMRLEDRNWEDDSDHGVIKLILPEVEDGERLRYQLFHQDGWSGNWNKTGERSYEIDFPTGDGYLMIGGAFSGHQLKFHDFHLESGQTLDLHPLPVAEPRISLLLPEDAEDLWLEAGEDSLTEDGVPLPLDEEFPVPADRELIVHFRLHGQLHLIPLGKAVDGASYDLRSSKPWSAPTTDLETSVQLIFPGPLPPGLKVELERPRAGVRMAPSAEQGGTFQVHGPAGSSFLVKIRAEGCVRTWHRGRLPWVDTSIASTILHTVPAASLRLEGLDGAEVEGIDAEDLKHLHPGPLNLVLRLADGSRYGVTLELQPGEQRVLRLVLRG